MILPFLRPIEPFILDPEVSEIMVNGPEHVFIERRGFLEEAPGVVFNERSLLVAVKNIARRLGSDISEEKPILDSRLPDGSRVAAVIPPCSLTGVTLTIRKFNARHLGMADLVCIGTLTEDVARSLDNAVLSRQNILISGGTATGKTTLLNILANAIPKDERILVIEDTAEIQIRTPNLVRFEARRRRWQFARRHHPRAPQGEPSPSARPHHPGRDSGRGSVRSCSNSSTPGTPARCPPSTPIPPPRP